MAKFKEIKVRFVPTKVVMAIPEPDLIEILKRDRGNFEVIDKNFKIPEEKQVVETTTFEQVVEEAEEKEYDREAREKELKKLKVADLIAYCDENKIAYAETDKKADLIEKIIAAETKNEEAKEETHTEVTTETTTEAQVVEE